VILPAIRNKKSFPLEIIQVCVCTMFMAIVDTKLTYIPMLAAILAFNMGYNVVTSAIAGFTIGAFYSLAARLVRGGRQQ